MFADVHIPESLTPTQFDDYLSKGWFRAGRTIFNTNFLHFDGTLYSAVWLRLILNDFKLTKSQKKKIQAVNRFTFKIQKFELTDEKEQLYAAYKSGISFSTAASLHQLLFDYHTTTAYETHEIATYDGEQLIGLGIFDVGNDTASGIVSVTHPDYKKYSLGTAMILKKIMHARDAGFRHFYPGYFTPGYPAFDYKLSFCRSCTEFLDVRQNEWLPMATFKPESTPIRQLFEKLKRAMQVLSDKKIKTQLLIYDYYDLNLTPQFNGQKLLDMPVILLVYEDESFVNELIIYDLLTGEYKLLSCDIVYYMPNTPVREGHYNHRILRQRNVVRTAVSVNDLTKNPRSHF